MKKFLLALVGASVVTSLHAISIDTNAYKKKAQQHGEKKLKHTQKKVEKKANQKIDKESKKADQKIDREIDKKLDQIFQ